MVSLIISIKNKNFYQFMLIIIANLHMKKIDDYFQDVAFSMGIKPEELLPIDRQVLQLQSANYTKGMTEKERQFYINKKMTILLQRQNKIFKQVEQQIRKRQFSYKLSADHKSNLHNPAVVKILTQHEKLINKNKRYIDTLFRKKAIDQSQLQRRQSITSDKYRLTDKSFRSNQSSVSNHSRKSNRSSHSSKLNQSTTSNKERLRAIRQKQKEQLQIKKELLQFKQEQDSRKSLRAMQNISRKSQRAKTKSEVNKLIVNENKKELQFMKNIQIKNHLEELKYKIQRTEMIRMKNHQHKNARQRNTNYKEIKKMIDQENKKLSEFRFNEKFKTASMRIENQQMIKNQARNFNKLTEYLRLDNAKKNRMMKNEQQKAFLNNVLTYENNRMRTAEVNRNQIKSVSKERYISRQIKREIAKKNLELNNSRRYQQTQQLKKRITSKLDEIDQVSEIKKQLHKQRQKIKKQSTFYRKSLDSHHQKFKINSFFQQ